MEEFLFDVAIFTFSNVIDPFPIDAFGLYKQKPERNLLVGLNTVRI